MCLCEEANVTAPKKSPGSKANRGPAAAAENRAALIDAAEELFATEGYEVPLAKIAQRAGVGRASLYRNFPTRVDLGHAVFDKQLIDIAALATNPDEYTFERVWKEVVTTVMNNSSLLEFVVAVRSYSDSEAPRVDDVLAACIPASRYADELDGLEIGDLGMTLGMLWGVMALTDDEEKKRERAIRALRLVHPLLADIAMGNTLENR